MEAGAAARFPGTTTPTDPVNLVGTPGPTLAGSLPRFTLPINTIAGVAIVGAGGGGATGINQLQNNTPASSPYPQPRWSQQIQLGPLSR